jgi:hypothetical protein
MSVATTMHQPAVTTAVLSGGQWLPSLLPARSASTVEATDVMLRISVPDFGLHLAAPLADLSTARNYSEVTVQALIDPGVFVSLRLKNEPAKSASDPIEIKEVSLNFGVGKHCPRAHFFSDSLYATLALAGPVSISIPEIGLDVGVHYDAPLPEISTLLQRRQIYFGLMVIERAAGLEFEIPENIPGEDIDAISFTYHTIVAREFRWQCNEVTLMMPATEESRSWLNNLRPRDTDGTTYGVIFGPAPKSRTIFGHTVALGDETVFLDDAAILNREKVLRELSLNDGHIVPVTFRPLSRKGRYVLPGAPSLPDEPWDDRIVGCINLEGVLDERLAARYHELAASTLAGLSPEEIGAVTERPTLGEDAHLMDD